MKIKGFTVQFRAYGFTSQPTQFKRVTIDYSKSMEYQLWPNQAREVPNLFSHTRTHSLCNAGWSISNKLHLDMHLNWNNILLACKHLSHSLSSLTVVYQWRGGGRSTTASRYVMMTQVRNELTCQPAYMWIVYVFNHITSCWSDRISKGPHRQAGITPVLSIMQIHNGNGDKL